MSESILSVKNLTQRLLVNGKPHTLVKKVSFDIRDGKTLAVVGESGSGKTVMAHSLLRIHNEPPFLSPEGEILFEGKNLAALSKYALRKIRGKRIAMIFQNPQSAINPVFTIGSQLQEIVKTHLKLNEIQTRELLLHTLSEVHLPRPSEHLNEYPHQMSGGMLQRVMIAGALLTEPSLLIADEPTTALDVTTQKKILQLLRTLQKKRKMSLLFITHDFGVVAEMGDDVVVMKKGEIVERGDVYTLFDHPVHEYTKTLLEYHRQRKET